MSLPWSFGSPAIDNDEDELSLVETFHEATKLNYAAFEPYERSTFVVHDLFLMSRGFRQFRSAAPVALADCSIESVQLGEVLRRRRSQRTLSGELSFDELSSVLNEALGPTAVVSDSNLDISHVLLAYPTAGGLSSIDSYVICSQVKGIDAGIYHYNAVASCLDRISKAAPIDVLRNGFFDQEFASQAAAGIIFVAVLDRLAPKYGEVRAYRLALLDAGHACQNVLLCAEALQMNSVALQGFCDDELAKALGVDSVREVVMHSVLLGKRPGHVHE